MKNFFKKLLGIPYKVNGEYIGIGEVERKIISLGKYIESVKEELEPAKYNIIMDSSIICTCADKNFTELDRKEHRDGYALCVSDSLYNFLHSVDHVISYDKRIISRVAYGKYEKISEIKNEELIYDLNERNKYYIIFFREKDYASYKIKFMK